MKSVCDVMVERLEFGDGLFDFISQPINRFAYLLPSVAVACSERSSTSSASVNLLTQQLPL